MKTWRRSKNRTQIEADAKKRRLKGKKYTESRDFKKAYFPEAEKIVYQEYKLARAQGIRVDQEFLSTHMIMAVKKLHPEVDFKGSNKWIRNFNRRNGISLQTKTNTKNKSVAERLPKVKHFHWWAVYQMATEEP